MDKLLKIKEAKNVNYDNRFIAKYYEDSGVFIVTNGSISDIILVNKLSNYCYFLCNIQELIPFFVEEKTSINENFVFELTRILTREKDKPTNH